jgi:DNA/RNA endonuclease YhcR with UshA esterase domain
VTAAVPVLADARTIAPTEAKDHVGQSVTVEGRVSEVHHTASGNAIFIDIGGRYPDNVFAAVIFQDDFDKFPDIDALEGKTVDVTGPIKRYKGKPEIILTDPAQIKTK